MIQLARKKARNTLPSMGFTCVNSYFQVCPIALHVGMFPRVDWAKGHFPN